MTAPPYHLGCPIWSNPDWNSRLYSADARRGDWLRQYASVFTAVEGNSTFYGLPKPAVVARWREETGGAFRFCFKFPRRISHELRLCHADAETHEFLKRLLPLEERLGPLFLQLHQDFGPPALPTLAAYLDGLPTSLAYAVEVRHPDFFAKGEAEKALNRLLHDRGMDRVCLDSRALFTARPDAVATREAQARKPRLPVHPLALGPQPLVRYIGHPEVEENRQYLAQWAGKIAQWLSEGRRPVFFTHTPDNQRAPELAERFHAALQEHRPELPNLAPWPGRALSADQQRLPF